MNHTFSFEFLYISYIFLIDFLHKIGYALHMSRNETIAKLFTQDRKQPAHQKFFQIKILMKGVRHYSFAIVYMSKNGREG